LQVGSVDFTINVTLSRHRANPLAFCGGQLAAHEADARSWKPRRRAIDHSMIVAPAAFIRWIKSIYQTVRRTVSGGAI